MTTDDQGVLLVSLGGAVATITLNRPDRGNGLTTELKERLLDALAKVGDDSSVRAVVLHRQRPRLLRRSGSRGARGRVAQRRQHGVRDR